MDYEQAVEFVHNWLWDSGEDRRTTKGMHWPDEYVVDTAKMIVAATTQSKEEPF